MFGFKEAVPVKKAIVYSLVLLAVLSLTLTIVPHTSAQTQNVKILTHSWYIDSIGLLVVVGEIQNKGPNTIKQVILGGTAQGSDGTSVDAMGTPAWVAYLAPNQKAPFYMEFYDQNNQNGGMWPASDVSNINLQVLQAEPTQNYSYPDVKVQASTGTVRADGAYWVTGTVKNTGTQTAQSVLIVGTYYNSAGTVVATGYSNASLIPSLAPSSTAEFQLGAFDLDQTKVPSEQKVAKYELLVQVQGPILVSTVPIVTPNPSDTQTTPTPTSTETSGSGPTGFPQNSPDSNTTEPLSTTAIIGIVIAVVIAVAAVTLLMMRKRKSQSQETDVPQRNQPKKTPKRERR